MSRTNCGSPFVAFFSLRSLRSMEWLARSRRAQNPRRDARSRRIRKSSSARSHAPSVPTDCSCGGYQGPQPIASAKVRPRQRPPCVPQYQPSTVAHARTSSRADADATCEIGGGLAPRSRSVRMRGGGTRSHSLKARTLEHPDLKGSMADHGCGHSLERVSHRTMLISQTAFALLISDPSPFLIDVAHLFEKRHGCFRSRTVFGLALRLRAGCRRNGFSLPPPVGMRAHVKDHK